MPEGPEIYILSKAINKYFENENYSYSKGKHLRLLETNEDWSFALNGTVRIEENNLLKVESGFLFGEKVSLEESKDLGFDWLSASEEELNKEIEKWKKSKKKLAGLLLDQKLICGIGVAWGSEILFKARLNPNKRACDQDLGNLGKAMMEIREEIIDLYKLELEKQKNKEEIRNLINNWFHNLYKIRVMKKYKIGEKVEVLGRTWWI